MVARLYFPSGLYGCSLPDVGVLVLSSEFLNLFLHLGGVAKGD